MTRIVVKKLIWDERNVEHIKKHNVTVDEVGSVAKSTLAHRKAKKGRYLIIGRAGKRILSVVLSRQGVGIYYLVTARDADKRERRILYEKEKKQIT